MDMRQRIGRLTAGEEPRDVREWVAYHGLRIAVVIALAMATYLLCPASPAVETPVFEVGSVATDDVIAPFAFAVRKTSAELTKEREDLAGRAQPIFVLTPSARDSVQLHLRGFFEAIDSAAGAAPPRQAAAAIQRGAAAHGVTLAGPHAEYLASAARRRAMFDALRRVYNRWLAVGVTASGALDSVRGEVILRRGPDERSMLADSVMTFSALVGRAMAAHPDPNSRIGDDVYRQLLGAFFRPTVQLDRAATDRRRAELRNSVSEVKHEVRTGEKIVGRHEVVGRAEHEKLRALQESMQARIGGRPWGRIGGAVIYNALVLAIFGITIVLFRPQLYQSFRALALFAILFLLVLVGGSLAAQLPPTVRPELVPVALAAVICSVLFDPRISMIAAMILAVLIGGQSVFRGTNALFLNLIGGAAAAISVRVIRRRDQMYRPVLTIASAYLLAAVAIGLTLDQRPLAIGTSAMWGAVNALISVSLAMLLLPLGERFTRITTDMTLLEYSDLNQGLLARLSREAPGTFAHTIAMANLVEAACNAIGANGLLGRVGTYYHDIGKLKKPQYFVENQPQGRNPHDKLKPGMSAAIIRNHVKEGLELAQEYRLPGLIAAFIPEHHGTLPISYFLEKAKERDGQTLNEAEFSYPGPIPQSAETAICMLADGVEAATKVLQDPTPQRIREVIDHIVRQRMEQGQLHDAPLTLGQLTLVKEQFARVLSGMYHARIDYPTSAGGVTSEFAARA